MKFKNNHFAEYYKTEKMVMRKNFVTTVEVLRVVKSMRYDF